MHQIIADIEVLEILPPNAEGDEVAIVRIFKAWKGARDDESLLVRSGKVKGLTQTTCAGPFPEKGAKARLALTAPTVDESGIMTFSSSLCYFFNDSEIAPQPVDKVRQSEKERKPAPIEALDGDSTDGSGKVIETIEDYRRRWSFLEAQAKERPDSFQAQFALAQFLVSWRDFRNALPPLKKAAALEPGNMEAQLLLTQVMQRGD